MGLLDRLRWADAAGRLGRSGLVLAGLVVAVGVEDAFLWGGRCPVRYRRLMAESGYSRSTVARRLPAVLALLAEVGGIVYDREVGEPYRVRVVDVDVLAGRGVGWLPWAAADSSHRLYPKGWSHTDRATYAVWWGWSGWCGDVAAPVDTDGLAARAGLRPSTLRRRSHPVGLWNHRGDRLAVGRWDDPPWTPTGSRSATTIIAVRCRAGPVSRVPRYVGTGTPTSRNRTPPPVCQRAARRWSAMGWSHRLQALLYNLRA